MLRKWLGTARYVFNATVKFLETPGTKANWMKIKTAIIQSLPEWAKAVPYQIKSLSVKDACIAVQNAKIKAKQTRVFQKVQFRSKKKRRDAIFIPKSAIKGQGVYPRLLGKVIETFDEPIPPAKHDCRLLFDHGNYFLCIPVNCLPLKPENQRGELVALDPGVRSFQTFCSFDLAGKFGSKDFTRIYRLCYVLDKLISQMAKARCKRKRRLRKAADRIRFKIRNLIDEIHHKVALWLCHNFTVIALPTFETSQMVTRLHSKTARAMLTWAHFRFKQFLKFKASELGCLVLDMNEAYTSKTCTRCGQIVEIGSRSVFKCSGCGLVLDRDINGARNILLRALVDTPCISNR